MNALIDTTDLKATALTLSDRVNALVVSSQEEAQEAFNLRKSIKDYINTVETHYEPHKKRAKAVHAGLCAEEKQILSPALQYLVVLDAKLSAFQAEENRRAEADRLRLEEESRKLAESQVLAQAAAAEAAGDKVEADAILTAPVEVQAVIQAKPQKLDGGHFRTDYYAQVSDPAAFFRAASEDKTGALRALWEVNESGLEKFAASTRGNVKIPGVVFGSRQVPVGR